VDFFVSALDHRVVLSLLRQCQPSKTENTSLCGASCTRRTAGRTDIFAQRRGGSLGFE
jgi:hypothetical protein